MRWHHRSLLVLGTLWLAASGAAAAQEKQAVAVPIAPATLGRGVEAGTLGPLSARKTPIVAAVERARGAVVNIQSERTLRNPAPADFFSLVPTQSRVNGMGTGIIIDPRGYIVTNHHVVEDVSSIRIRL